MTQSYLPEKARTLMQLRESCDLMETRIREELDALVGVSSNREVARAVGVTAPHMRDIRRGARTISDELLRRLARLREPKGVAGKTDSKTDSTVPAVET